MDANATSDPGVTREPLTEDEVEFILFCLGHTAGSEHDKPRRDKMLARGLAIREKLCAMFDE